MVETEYHREARITRYSELLEAFSSFDTNNIGTLSLNYIVPALRKLGCKSSDSEILEAVKAAEVDPNSDKISFYDFKRIYQEACKGDPMVSAIGNAGSRSNLYHYGTYGNRVDDDTLHSVSEEEQVGFSSWIEKNLIDDPECKRYLPFQSDGSDLYDKCKDGIILCKIINCSIPNTIDHRAINRHLPLTTYQMHENITLALNSARAIGCNVVNIGAGDIWNGTKHLLLGLLWQVIKIGLLKQINVVAHAELATLLEGEETINDFAKLSPEEILIRWVNYHLKDTESGTRMENFSFDVRNSEVYAYLVEKITPQEKKQYMHSARAILDAVDLVQRAEMVLQNAEQLNCRVFVRPEDIVSGSQKLNLAFLANLFHGYPALEKQPEVEEEVADIEETREEKTYRNWINSLGYSQNVNYLFYDLVDGLILLRLFDSVQPHIVDWTEVHEPICDTPAKANFNVLVENCNYVVKLGRQIGFSLVGVGGADLHDGKRTMTLALLWQLMRAYTLSLLTQLTEAEDFASGKSSSHTNGTSNPIEETRIIEWANQKLANSGKFVQISTSAGFTDPNLKTSHAVIDLIEAIRPNTVDYNLVLPGNSKTEQLANAQYAITLARRIGAIVYAMPEDLIELKHKMIMTIFACLMAVDLKHNRKPDDSWRQVEKLEIVENKSFHGSTHSSRESLETKSYLYVGTNCKDNKNLEEDNTEVVNVTESEKSRKPSSKPALLQDIPRPPPEKIYVKSFRVNLSSCRKSPVTCLDDTRQSCSPSGDHAEVDSLDGLVTANLVRVTNMQKLPPPNRSQSPVKHHHHHHHDMNYHCIRTSSRSWSPIDLLPTNYSNKTHSKFTTQLSKSTSSVNQVGLNHYERSLSPTLINNTHTSLSATQSPHERKRHATGNRELAFTTEKEYTEKKITHSTLYTLVYPKEHFIDLQPSRYTKSSDNNMKSTSVTAITTTTTINRPHGGGRIFLATGARKD
ncbi:Plastin-3 [Schistosoma japonicum]|uniref:Plastin-3 n=1 Tax=Schistosoma japonicum TaxID=6182 RepID=A0A4Z2CR98_SCHJA|nr:Plastin-3 [Schistosoma japonicum]